MIDRTKLARLVKRRMPLRLHYEAAAPAQTWVVLAPERTGQHLLIDWLGRGLGQAVHINNVYLKREGIALTLKQPRPKVTRYEGGEIVSSEQVAFGKIEVPPGAHVIYSVENSGSPDLLAERVEGSGARMIVHLRDPYNWAASLVKRIRDGYKYTSEDRLPGFLTYYMGLAAEELNGRALRSSYNEFVASKAFREGLAAQVGPFDLEAAEAALGEVPQFGRGSSFDGAAASPDALRTKGTQRWRAVADDPLYLALIRTPGLVEAYAALYDDLPDARAELLGA